MTDDQRGGNAEAVGQILARLMRDVKPAPRRRKSGVQAAWARAAGAELSEEARPSTLRKGVLTVEVRSTALLHELESFRKDELLARLLEEDSSGRVSGLRFRLGVF